MLEIILVIVVLIFIVAGMNFVRQANDEDKARRMKGKTERKKRKAKEKGDEGEWRVQRAIEKVSRGRGRLLNDVVLKDKDGKSYQIDHIFINWNGVWVIETKNWSGRIYGSDEQKEWTQVLAYGNEKHRLYNPVKQNLTHLYKISPLLGKKVMIIPLVVFVDADLRGVSSKYTCHISQLPSFLQQNYGFSLTEKEIEECYQKLLWWQAKSGVTSEEHSRIQESKQEGIKQGICPNCGGTLIERTSQNGAFYGCSNFPQCRFTMKK